MPPTSPYPEHPSVCFPKLCPHACFPVLCPRACAPMPHPSACFPALSPNKRQQPPTEPYPANPWTTGLAGSKATKRKNLLRQQKRAEKQLQAQVESGTRLKACTLHHRRAALSNPHIANFTMSKSLAPVKTGWTNRNQPRSSEEFRLEDLMEMGLELIEWDGR